MILTDEGTEMPLPLKRDGERRGSDNDLRESGIGMENICQFREVVGLGSGCATYLIDFLSLARYRLLSRHGR